MTDPTDDECLERAIPYAGLGYFISEVSRAELAIDEMIMAAHRQHSEIAERISQSFPKQINQKLTFWLGALVDYPRLRGIPFLPDGSLKLNIIYSLVLEFFDVRNHVAHGAITRLTKETDRILYQSKKTEYIKSSGTVREQNFRFSSVYLETMADRAGVVRRYFLNLKDRLEDKFSWEEFYQERKAWVRTRNLFQEFGFHLPENFNRFSLTLCLPAGLGVGP